MPKGDERGDGRRGRPARAAQGRRGSKNYEPARLATGDYRPGARTKPKGFKGTKGFDYKGGGGEAFVAGANILDKKGKVKARQGFSEYLKATGNRADDPRNWEFHYKAPGSRYSTRGKNDRQVDNVGVAKGQAMRKASREGKSIYEVQQIEYETAGIVAGTSRASAISKAKGGSSAFGSTQVSSNVAAQKRSGRRRAGGGGGTFNAPTQTRTSRIA